MTSRRAAAVASAIAVLAGGIAGGFALVRAEEPEAQRVLHEDVASPPPRNGRPLGASPRAGRNPAAIRTDARAVPEPNPRQAKGEDEPILGRGGFAADRNTSAAPDRATGSDATLRYVTVFNPTVLPFKRMSALDTVGADYRLGIATGAVSDLPVGGDPSSARDQFWGSVVIDLAPGVDVPLPSVSPEMRILSYEVQPRTQLAFSKDGADNYYVRSDEPAANGTYRVVFLADAAKSYFAPSMPRGYRLGDLAKRVPKGLAPAFPKERRAAAAEAIRVLAIDERTAIHVAFDRLVGYFRAFTPGPPPPSRGDIFLELFHNQVGVCRHRSFAFIVVAHALGIPARYVTNEAHAFVEVWLPDTEWMRIDLGGAALRLDVENADAKTMHRPAAEDPFAKPKSYDQNYTRLEGDVRGLDATQLAEARAPFEDQSTAADGGDGADGTGSNGNAASTAGRTGRVGPGRSLPTVSPSATAGKLPVDLLIDSAASVGYRGEALTVSGRALTNGRAIQGLRIDIYLAPRGQGGDDARLIGVGTSGADGSFRIGGELPLDLALTDYEIFAATSGDRTYAPALSDE